MGDLSNSLVGPAGDSIPDDVLLRVNMLGGVLASDVITHARGTCTYVTVRHGLSHCFEILTSGKEFESTYGSHVECTYCL